MTDGVVFRENVIHLQSNETIQTDVIISNIDTGSFTTRRPIGL